MPHRRAGPYPKEKPLSHLDAVVIHCRRPGELAPFYAELLGLPIDPQDDASIQAGTLGERESVLLGRREALHVWLTPVPDLEPAPGRIHLDVRLDSPEEPARLIALGATHAWDDPRGRWSVCADPEGNLFCAIHPNPGGPPPA